MLRIRNGELESGVLCDRRERLAAYQTLFVAAAHDKQGAVRAQAAGVRDRIRACPCQPEHASRILKCVFHSALEFGNKKFCGRDHERLLEPRPRDRLKCLEALLEIRRLPSLPAQKRQPERSLASLRSVGGCGSKLCVSLRAIWPVGQMC